MIWDDTGFLLSKNRYNENSLIVEIFTEKHGKVSGIIFGGTSKKIKNYLQIGNQLYVNYNAKSENRIGYFKIEILNAYSPFFFDEHEKLLCLTSAMQLIKILTAESQKNIKIYELISDFFKVLNLKDWIKNYIFWELEILKVLGYDLELVNLVEKNFINNEIRYKVKSSNSVKFVPNFMIESNVEVTNKKSLIEGLKLVGDYLEKSILRPNNLNYPSSRLQFVNALK